VGFVREDGAVRNAGASGGEADKCLGAKDLGTRQFMDSNWRVAGTEVAVNYDHEGVLLKMS
jgi:hypothetical protein